MAGVISVAAAAVMSWVWCRALPSLGPRLGYVDQPDDDRLKVHRVAAVPLAGPGILVGVLVVLAVTSEFDPALAAGLVAITALGTVDDRVGLSPRLRLLAEVAIAALIAVRWLEGPGYYVFGVVVIVVTINAVNLYDGIDMLAGTTGMLGAAALGFAAAALGLAPWAALGLAAGLAGFLPHNLPPAKVFLGDGGAYLVGAVTAVTLVDIGVSGGATTAVAALGFLGMFLVDLIITVARRRLSGAPMFEGDRSHTYDRMITAGLAVPEVVGRLALTHAVVVIAAAAALVWLSPLLALAVVALAGLAVTTLCWRVPPLSALDS